MKNNPNHKSLLFKDFKKQLTNFGIVVAISSITMSQANAIESISSGDASIHVKSGVQQSRKISGVITDKSGQPVIGANVVVKGTTRGISTDYDGKYSIEVNEGEILTYNYIGFKTIEIIVDSKKTIINVKMQEDVFQT